MQWKKGKLLGTGAYSTCYAARDIKSGTLMAVKQVSQFIDHLLTTRPNL